MLLNIPFDVNRHVLISKTVRKKGKTGGAIFVPNQYVGNRCLVLMELFDDENEVPKWINFIIQAIKARPYEDPRYPYR